MSNGAVHSIRFSATELALFQERGWRVSDAVHKAIAAWVGTNAIVTSAFPQDSKLILYPVHWASSVTTGDWAMNWSEQ